MRPIDADKLIQWLTNSTGFLANCEDCNSYGRECVLCIVEEAIQNAPTIETKPVVRCEDCKHHCASDSYTGEKHDFHLCYKFNKLTKNKDFCSYGEKRKEYAYY